MLQITYVYKNGMCIGKAEAIGPDTIMIAENNDTVRVVDGNTWLPIVDLPINGWVEATFLAANLSSPGMHARVPLESRVDYLMGIIRQLDANAHSKFEGHMDSYGVRYLRDWVACYKTEAETVYQEMMRFIDLIAPRGWGFGEVGGRLRFHQEVN